MSQQFKILIVDDQVDRFMIIVEALRERYDVEIALDGAEAINCIQKTLYDVILLDVHLPRIDGMEVLKFIHENSPSLQVIIISGQADVRMAVETTRLGAFEVLKKPFDIDEIENVIELALERKKLATDNKLLKTELSRRAGSSMNVGESAVIQQVIESSRRVAESDSIVL